MNKREMALKCASYILSQDHERKDLLDRLSREEFNNTGNLKGYARSSIDHARSSIWYIAMVLGYGRKEANKELKELLKEI